MTLLQACVGLILVGSELLVVYLLTSCSADGAAAAFLTYESMISLSLTLIQVYRLRYDSFYMHFHAIVRPWALPLKETRNSLLQVQQTPPF